jgi:CRISPR/Cas system-associated exonuclease Cas4 (RecB family)
MKYSPYSASKLAFFAECPKKFYFRYIEKPDIPKEPEKKFFEKGHFFHHVLRYYPDKKPFYFRVSDSTDVDEYEKVLTRVLKSDRIIKLTREPCAREKSFKIFEGWQVAGGKSLFRGYIDYLTVRLSKNEAEIIDWKTGKVYPDKSSSQLMIYAIWLFLQDQEKGQGKINTITCSYYYLEHEQEITHVFHKKDIQDLIQHFDEQINTIEKEEEFPKKLNKWCHNCDFFDYCDPHKPENLNLGDFKDGKIYRKRT